MTFTSSSAFAWLRPEKLEIKYTLLDPQNWEGEWTSTKHWDRVDRYRHYRSRMACRTSTNIFPARNQKLNIN